MGSFAQQLSETATTWRNAVAPHAERTEVILWSTVPRPSGKSFPATPLTQNHRRAAKGFLAAPTLRPAPQTLAVCRICGMAVKFRRKYCPSRSVTVSTEVLVEAAHKGRIAGQTAPVLARLGEKQSTHRRAELSWKPADKPDWLDDKAYVHQIRPRLADVTISNIALTLGVSMPYASARSARVERDRIRDTG
jgi:hypothetical protein